MEQLCLKSFLAQGHEFHLYVYQNTTGVPEGVTIRDANEILPSSNIFVYTHQASYSGFSNFFRYKLLLERGGYWVDTDMVCLRPFDFTQDYVFSSEFHNKKPVPNTGVIKAPQGSPVMQYAWDICRQKDPAQLSWGETGPSLMRSAIETHGLLSSVTSPETLCPIAFADWETVLMDGVDWRFNDTTRAIHLWNEMWRRGGKLKDAAYAPGCLYEQLKSRYEVRSCL